MPTRTYTRPDGVTATHVATISVTLWADGTWTGTLSAWEPGGERMRHYPGLKGEADGAVAPRALEALQGAAQLSLDLWGRGEVR